MLKTESICCEYLLFTLFWKGFVPKQLAGEYWIRRTIVCLHVLLHNRCPHTELASRLSGYLIWIKLISKFTSFRNQQCPRGCKMLWKDAWRADVNATMLLVNLHLCSEHNGRNRSSFTKRENGQRKSQEVYRHFDGEQLVFRTDRVRVRDFIFVVILMF